MRLRSFCRALFVLNVAYCVLAVMQPGLPGWRMFESVDRLDYALFDKDGAPIDLHAYVPAHARLIDETELRRVVSFACRKERARAPLRFEDRARGTTTLLGPHDCQLDAPR